RVDGVAPVGVPGEAADFLGVEAPEMAARRQVRMVQVVADVTPQSGNVTAAGRSHGQGVAGGGSLEPIDQADRSPGPVCCRFHGIPLLPPSRIRCYRPGALLVRIFSDLW